MKRLCLASFILFVSIALVHSETPQDFLTKFKQQSEAKKAELAAKVAAYERDENPLPRAIMLNTSAVAFLTNVPLDPKLVDNTAHLENEIVTHYENGVKKWVIIRPSKTNQGELWDKHPRRWFELPKPSKARYVVLPITGYSKVLRVYPDNDKMRVFETIYSEEKIAEIDADIKQYIWKKIRKDYPIEQEDALQILVDMAMNTPGLKLQLREWWMLQRAAIWLRDFDNEIPASDLAERIAKIKIQIEREKQKKRVEELKRASQLDEDTLTIADQVDPKMNELLTRILASDDPGQVATLLADLIREGDAVKKRQFEALANPFKGADDKTEGATLNAKLKKYIQQLKDKLDGQVQAILSGLVKTLKQFSTAEQEAMEKASQLLSAVSRDTKAKRYHGDDISLPTVARLMGYNMTEKPDVPEWFLKMVPKSQLIDQSDPKQNQVFAKMNDDHFIITSYDEENKPVEFIKNINREGQLEGKAT